MAKRKIKSKIKTKPKKLKISACYIVKNNADELKTSIESLKHAVDEIIVVDTGSTDSTVEVAKSFGAKVFYREWDDDFSAPRNLAIENATGDWIVFLDSDEYFSDKTKKNVRPAIEKAEEFGAEVLFFHRVNLDHDEEGRQIIQSTDFSTRALKNQPGLHYVGKIHEQPIVYDRERTVNFPVTAKNLTVYHTGYVGPLSKAKSERNLKLLLEELETTDNPKRIWHYIAGSYLGLGDYEKAEKFARMDVDTGLRDDTLADNSYKIMITILRRDESRLDELEEILNRAIKDFPDMPEFSADLGQLYAMKKDYKKAVESMKSAIQKFKNYSPTEVLSTSFNEEAVKNSEELIEFWSTQIKISACYIVKNNADELKTSIESLKHAVDEIVVVDTGSTDSTVEVAKSFGAKVFYREWDDDFSAPRNLAIENATGDWIVFLDSDEYFSDETKNNIRPVLEQAEKFKADGLLIYRVNFGDDMKNIKTMNSSDFSLRVLKNQPGLHYIYKIHEQPAVDGKELLLLPTPNEKLMLYHTGYAGALSRAKAERNLKLLLEEFETTDNPKRLYGHLAQSYLNVGDKIKAEKFARLDIETGKSPTTFPTLPYRVMFNILGDDSERDGEFLEFIKFTVSEFPEMPDFYFLLGKYYLDHNKKPYAIATFDQGMEKFKTYDENKEGEPSTITTEIKALIEKELRVLKGTMTISACYIVKNNADELKTSLESLKHAVDEIIVVDTGSTDSTVEVAKSFGAKVFYREWDDDFSAPRNLAIENATGDWIVFLDSDEYFSDNTKKNLRPAIERVDKFKKVGLLIYRVEIDKNRGNQILGTNYVMRILKNQPELHYVGKIHEQPEVKAGNLGEITFAPANILTLIHTGYSASINEAKARRNLKLLLEELAETDRPQRIYGYIAECYNGLGDFANAEKFARLDLEFAEEGYVPMCNSCRIILGILSEDFKRFEDRKKFAEIAVKKFPKMPEFTAELAECFAMYGDLKNAIQTMKSALEKFKNYHEIESTQFDENMAKFAQSRIKLWSEKLNRR